MGIESVTATVKVASSGQSDSAWWAFKRLQDAASADLARATPLLREAWAELEGRIEAERTLVEAQAREAAVAGDALHASELASAFMERSVAAALARAEELSLRLA